MDPEELARQADEELNSVIVEPEPVEPDTDDDDDDADPAPPSPETGRPSRQERRRQRAGNYNELKETTARLEAALQQEREARARMEGLMQANLQQPRQQQGPHPAEQAVRDAMREQDEFYKSFTAQLPNMSEAQKQQAGERAQELEVKKGLAMTRLALAQQGIGRGPDPQQIRQLAFQEQLNQTFPDIAADPKAMELGGHIARAMFAEGKPQTWETLHEAAEETRRRLGMKSTRQPPKPTERQQARFTGASKGPTGGATAEAKPLRITKKQAQMAENAYPNLPPGKAHQKWWNEVGKKYA